MRAVSVAAIVLAAGASRRLGRPKQTLDINGESLLARAVRLANAAGLSPVFIVVANATMKEAISPGHATVLLNPGASEGIASSIRIGIAAAMSADVEGAILMTCDQPALTVDHLHSLSTERDAICGSSYSGTIGIPAYFPASKFESLLALRGDRGARSLLHNAHSIPAEALSLDIDTEKDLRRAQRLLDREKRG